MMVVPELSQPHEYCRRLDYRDKSGRRMTIVRFPRSLEGLVAT